MMQAFLNFLQTTYRWLDHLSLLVRLHSGQAHWARGNVTVLKGKTETERWPKLLSRFLVQIGFNGTPVSCDQILKSPSCDLVTLQNGNIT